MTHTLKGKLIGCYQDDTGCYARIESPDFKGQTAEIPIPNELFYKLIFHPATITLEIE